MCPDSKPYYINTCLNIDETIMVQCEDLTYSCNLCPYCNTYQSPLIYHSFLSSHSLYQFVWSCSWWWPWQLEYMHILSALECLITKLMASEKENQRHLGDLQEMNVEKAQKHE